MSHTYRYLSGERLAFEPKVASLVGTHTPGCWGCGPEALQGLGLEPRLDGSQIRADLEFAPRFEGGPGTVHGGAIAAFMDDLLGYVPVAYGSPGVTAKLDTNFIAPVPVGVTVGGTAWMSHIDGSKMWAEGAIEVEGHVLVESAALFIAIGPDHYQRVFDGFTKEQLERFRSYRSADYYP
jgi:acyl-coenzyme A thioesterase PaaI-like protein